MITGIGTDIVQLSRIASALARRGDSLARRLLADSEWQRYQTHSDPVRFLGKRFAAKEAALKALGTGLRQGIRWHDVAVTNDGNGKPSLTFSGVAGKIMVANRCHLSISDEQDYALAFVIIESES
ncbi:holo-ACP synthase [Alcanivorax sp. 1008]|uniref:holo-ACP synthase n=1 Tax=Alcanivorax sp. 1008 TaxID=2816853 RepID=UPI001D713AE3|nr:holo-ACP synthase [Alcanivorax sp. 1008]MCC1495612.1 holo-ACP synthase [Alcanivorax sp. 1008]